MQKYILSSVKGHCFNPWVPSNPSRLSPKVPIENDSTLCAEEKQHDLHVAGTSEW